MSPRLDIEGLADAVQLLGKLIQHRATVVGEERVPSGAVESITRVLKQVGAEIDRNGAMCGTTDLSLTLYAARELERYIRGEKTQICNRHIAEVYYHVLCAGIGQLPRLDQDLSE
jgi:hypothetical protein